MGHEKNLPENLNESKEHEDFKCNGSGLKSEFCNSEW